MRKPDLAITKTTSLYGAARLLAFLIVSAVAIPTWAAEIDDKDVALLDPKTIETDFSDNESTDIDLTEPPVAEDTVTTKSTSSKQGFFKRFTDDQDGKFDFSNFLAKGGFIPIPIIITEPAVDGGFGLAAAFLTVPSDDPRHVTKTVIGAVKTRNGSRGIGVFRSGYAFSDRLNYRIGVGRGKVTLEAFPVFAPQGIEYTNRYKYGIIGSALWSFGRGFSAGPLVDFRKLSSELDIPGLPERFSSDFNNTLHTGALGLGIHYDNRDNPLTPTTGINIYFEGKANRDAFGSDRSFEEYDANLFLFNRLTSNLRYGAKVEIDAIRGDFPAYFAPSIDLRGVQAGRYQGENSVSSELELTWQLNPRWSLLAFGGVGRSDAGERRIFEDSGLIASGGAGFRYRLARKLGLDAGLDLAYGPDGFTFYVQFGHAWSLKMD